MEGGNSEDDTRRLVQGKQILGYRLAEFSAFRRDGWGPPCENLVCYGTGEARSRLGLSLARVCCAPPRRGFVRISD